MTIQEFSSEFDILYNNIASNLAPGLDEYEKSVFLTKAQEELVKNYFNKLGNKYQEGYGDSSKRNINLDSLVNIEAFALDNTATNRYDKRSLSPAGYPEAMLILGEHISIYDPTKALHNVYTVVELSHSEYNRLMLRPYSRPSATQAWKIKGGYNTAEGVNNYEYILPVANIEAELNIRYVEYPKPIILEDLQGVTINGLSYTTECALDESIHQEILQRAVEIAKASYIGDINTAVELGKRSE